MVERFDPAYNTDAEDEEEGVVVCISTTIPYDMFGDKFSGRDVAGLEYEVLEAAFIGHLFQFTGALTEEAQQSLLKAILIDDWAPSDDSYMEHHEEEKYGGRQGHYLARQFDSDDEDDDGALVLGKVCMIGSGCGKMAFALVNGTPGCVDCLSSMYEDTPDNDQTTCDHGVLMSGVCRQCDPVGWANMADDIDIETGKRYIPGVKTGAEWAAARTKQFGTPSESLAEMAKASAKERAKEAGRWLDGQHTFFCQHQESLTEACKPCNREAEAIEGECVHGQTFSEPCVRCQREAICALATTDYHDKTMCIRCNPSGKKAGGIPRCVYINASWHEADRCNTCKPGTTKAIVPIEEKPITEIGGIPIIRKREVKA